MSVTDIRAAAIDGRRMGGAATNVLTVVCAVIVAGVVLLALVGPLIAPRDPYETSVADAYGWPSADAPLGLDSQGRDILSRLIAGARTTILGPLVVVIVVMTIATAIALATAWAGGLVDSTASTFLDVMLGFPGIVLAVLAAAIFGPGILAPTVALGIAYIPYVARILRSSFVRERSLEYIAVCELQGIPAVLIGIRHLLPNVLPLIVAQAVLLFGIAMIEFAAISYLGLGVQPPTADWGQMIASGQRGVLLGYPGESLAAGAAIVTVVLAVNFLGERLAERNSA